MILPAFRDSLSLKTKIEALALSLTDAATEPQVAFREALSRELLAVSSVLSVARVGGLLSPMNSDLITKEVQTLLEDVAAYEEPRLPFAEDPSLAALARQAPVLARAASGPGRERPSRTAASAPERTKGQSSPRQEAILSLISEKGTVSIKDISLTVRGVSEKTIQRELSALIEAGRVVRKGERRWSTYSIS